MSSFHEQPSCARVRVILVLIFWKNWLTWPPRSLDVVAPPSRAAAAAKVEDGDGATLLIDISVT